MPFVAGVVAAGAGVLGIFMLNALTLAIFAVALQRGPQPRGRPTAYLPGMTCDWQQSRH